MRPRLSGQALGRRDIHTPAHSRRLSTRASEGKSRNWVRLGHKRVSRHFVTSIFKPMISSPQIPGLAEWRPLAQGGFDGLAGAAGVAQPVGGR